MRTSIVPADRFKNLCFQEAGGNVAPSGEGGFMEVIHRLELTSIFVNFLLHPSNNILSVV